MDEDIVRRRIRHKLRDGRLPQFALVQLWRGHLGERCHACEEPITIPAVTLRDLRSTRADLLPLHVSCFLVWDEERRGPDGRVRSAQT